MYSELSFSLLILAILNSMRMKDDFLRTQTLGNLYIIFLCILSSIIGVSLAGSPEYSIPILCLMGIVYSDISKNEKSLLFFGGSLILYCSFKLGFGLLESGVAIAFGYTIYLITEKNEE